MTDQIRLSFTIGGFEDNTPDVDFSATFPKADAVYGFVADLANKMSTEAVSIYWTVASFNESAATNGAAPLTANGRR